MILEEYLIKDISVITSLKEDIKNNLDTSMKNTTNVKGSMTNYKHFIGRKTFEPIKKLLNKFAIYEAWGNVLKKGEYVKEHHHISNENNNFKINISGILYLTDIKPGTYFKEFNKTIDPKIGKIIVFDNKYKHSVDKCDTDEERITLAFNGRKKENYEF
jgi:Rps23 Pro-64 3,4-dihydroxylase Tpa1-like proline 4-hydroxylase